MQASHFFGLTSQIFNVLSQLPDASRLPSWLNATVNGSAFDSNNAEIILIEDGEQADQPAHPAVARWLEQMRARRGRTQSNGPSEQHGTDGR